jgi:hypothetical protein
MVWQPVSISIIGVSTGCTITLLIVNPSRGDFLEGKKPGTDANFGDAGTGDTPISLLKKGDRHLTATAFRDVYTVGSEPVPLSQQAAIRGNWSRAMSES